MGRDLVVAFYQMYSRHPGPVLADHPIDSRLHQVHRLLPLDLVLQKDQCLTMDRLGFHLQDRQGHQHHGPKIVVLSHLPHEACAFEISLDEACFHQFQQPCYCLSV